MMISRPFLNRQFLEEEEEEEECRDDADFQSDDSDGDPSYCAVEEKFDQFSRTVEQTEPELDETDSNDTVLHFSKLDIMDDQCLEKIKMIVEAGQIEKLKVDHCKMYLRKNGLRLSGNKYTLVKRIKEHLEILNAGGEKKYPVSSFVLNCTGDACTGDVVMFEQNVYEMFNIASRSATGPPCGTRTIVGRIVKEGYGAAKQQHTFTVEVLWSKGTKPLPPLYPLLIKGRNLYRMKTLRQRWENEGDRQRVLLEKHSRGSLARSARETRVLEKEKRKMLKKNRVSRKEGSNGSSTTQAQKTAFIVSESSRKSADPQRSSLSTDSKKVPLEIIHGHNRKENQNQTRASQNIADNIKKNGGEHFQKVPSQRNIVDFPPQSSRPSKGMNLQSTGEAILQGHMQQQQYCRYHFQEVPSQRNIIDFPQSRWPLKGMNLLPTGQAILQGHMQQQEYCRQPFQKVPSQRNIIDFPPQLSRPLKGMNLQSTGRPILQGHMQQQQYCRYPGRCYYGENCKFSHDIREKCVTEMRGPDVLRSLVMREYH